MVILSRLLQAAAWLGWAAMWVTAQLFYWIGDGFQWAARQFRAASDFCRRRAGQEAWSGARGAEAEGADREGRNATTGKGDTP